MYKPFIKVKNLLTIVILNIFSFSLSAQTVHNLNSEEAVLFRYSTSSVPQEFRKEAKSARPFTINPALQSATSVRKGDIVSLELFDNQDYNATISNITTDVNGTVALTLQLTDYPMGFAIITTSSEGKSLVNVSIPELGLGFGSRYDAGTKQNYLIEIDQSGIKRLDCGTDAMITPEKVTEAAHDEDNRMPQLRSSCAPTGTNVNSPATIDVLVVYTAAAANSSYASEHGGIENIISTMINLGNLSLSNSQTGITLSLAHSAEVDYTETKDMGVSLDYLGGADDGYMDNVHALRKQYNADLVQLVTTDPNYGGIGYLLTGATGNYNWAFSVVNVTQVGGDYPASVHELGHNLGLGHGATQITNKATGLFGYSYGWTWNGTTSVTQGGVNTVKKGSVMSYWGGENYSDGIPCLNVPYFSNPTISFEGQPTGSAVRADAARSLREMKHIIAFYSDRGLNILDAPTNVVASNPTVRGATITWDRVPGAVSYKLYFFYNGGWWTYSNILNNSIRLNDATYFQQCKQYEIYVAAVNDCGDDSPGSQHITFNTACTYTITFDAQGGSVNPATRTVTSGSAVGNLPVALRGGYTFEGWFTEIDGGGTEFTSSTVYNYSEDLTLYAKWAVNTYTLTFDARGGTVSPATQTVTYGSPVGTLPTPIRSGYIFDGWFTVIGGLGEQFTSATVYDNPGDLTLYATWINPLLPVITTLEATDISSTTATLNKSVVPGLEPIINQGFMYQKLAIGSSWTDISSTDSNYSLSGLTANTQYFFYAYATTALGIVEGNIMTFSTSSEVSNEAIAENAIWGTAGVLHVKASVPGVLSVYSITGRLVIQQNVVDSGTFTLSRGLYIVKMNGLTTKVFL
ncbi:MAG: InlB B-repeat-containing protein [Tannerella sp.]|jgi:uncharacterized repeat protein (TIGR02543 family)|nr:InlB B-repeat-containing protein [Tannerella sp.]